MAYVAVKGGQVAIENSIKLLNENISEIEIDVIIKNQKYLINQVMSEASLYSFTHAARAIIQSQGSVEEAVFLLRSYRSTLPRIAYSKTIDTDNMIIKRRISAAFRDIAGGQLLGSTSDYTHRLLQFSPVVSEKLEQINFELLDNNIRVLDELRKDNLLKNFPITDNVVDDITKQTVKFPASRSQILQSLTRGMSEAVVSFGYSALRGYGQLHPTVGELRVGELDVCIDLDGEEYYVGNIEVCECETLIPVNITEADGQNKLIFDVGYGIVFGQNESKTIAMSILDQTLQVKDTNFIVNDDEFILSHIDSLEANGFISHLKLPHYVTFSSKLDSMKKGDKNE